MAKVTTLKRTVNGIEFSATLNVNGDGIFSVRRPGTHGDWPDCSMTIEADTADAVKIAWHEAVEQLCAASSTERKVIAIHYDSVLRNGGKKTFHLNRCAMLYLACTIALEKTTVRGDKKNIELSLHPDYRGFGSPKLPFPALMTLDDGDLRFHQDESLLLVVEWSQEVEDALVRACRGIKAIVDLLDRVTASPTVLIEASSTLALSLKDQASGDENAPVSDARKDR